MDFDIVISDNKSVINIPDIISLDDEFEQVAKEMFVHKAAMEFSVYRIYRIHRDGLWRERFKSLNEYVAYIEERFDISAATIRNRLSTYAGLEWAGYSPSDAIQMMMAKPQLYTQSMRSLVEVNAEDAELKIVAPEDKEPQEIVKEILDNVSEMSLHDARNYLSENYTMEPTVSVTYEGTQIIVNYTTFAPTLDGGVDIEEIGKVIYTPTRTDVPKEVQQFIERMVRRGNYTS